MKIVVISASPRRAGKTHAMMDFVYDYTGQKDHEVVLINPAAADIECYRGPGEQYNDATRKAAADITDADVWLVGTPVYNSFFSSALKNLFEYVDYKKTAGKTAGVAILASGQISFVDVQTMVVQLMSYFRVITNPKAVFMTADAIQDGRVSDEDARARLRELVDETIGLASRLR